MIGVLLINLGTPAAATPCAVRAYLKEFLSDPRVIDIPWIFRMALLYGIILPFRTTRVTEAYQKIWTPEGSPLLVESQKFSVQLQAELGDRYQVLCAMRYGEPALQAAYNTLIKQGCEKIVAIPLFPQYANATTGSILAQLATLQCQVVPPFYNHPAYISSMVERIRDTMSERSEREFILFSYHGLPERQLQCAESGRLCYKAHCFATTAALVQSLGLDASQYMTSFQSRLGGARWIQPYTDQVLAVIRERGIRRIMVVCPSFVVDCLETLEEVCIRLRAQWLSLGGEALTVIPCLNSAPYWVRAMAQIVRAF